MDLARQDAAKAGVKVTPADVSNERATMLKGFFPDADPSDYEQLLEQLLKQQNVTRPQFDIVRETNAYLRKMAEPLCAGKISDENVQQAFDVMYGSTVKIRDIQVSNMQEAMEVKRRAAAGEKFDDLAAKLSHDPSARELRGEWPAFSRNTTGISDAIKEQAFALKDGEISDPISTEGTFHVIKVEQHIAPRGAKLDDATKASIRGVLSEKLVQETMKALRARTAQEALEPSVLQIRDPELKKQFEQRVAEHAAQVKEAENARQQKALRPCVLPATRPTSAPPA